MNISQLRAYLNRQPLINSNWRCYTGVDAENLTEVLNTDGTQPYIRQISVREDSGLALLETYDYNSEVYRVRVDVNPDSNLTWWLSFDNGVTAHRCQFERYEARAQGAFWRVTLSGLGAQVSTSGASDELIKLVAIGVV